MRICDIAIIGGGIAGSLIAYTLKKEFKTILVFDKRGIAKGGSGAAGAFISPKIGKGSTLQTLTNNSFLEAISFYKNNFPNFFNQTGVLRVPKDSEDNLKFNSYKPYLQKPYLEYSKEKISSIGLNILFDSIFFKKAGVCEAQPLCNSLLEDIEFKKEEIISLKKEKNNWILNNFYIAKKVILATGYETNLIDIDYMGIKGTWGSRGDFKTSKSLNISLHQNFSISASKNQIVKIGATHEKEIKKYKNCESIILDDLKEKASKTLLDSNLELKEIFCGMRSGSKDYFPLVGKIVDVSFMLKTYPKIKKGAKPNLKYLENIYILNGLGGRGFVFSPLMAKYLKYLILEEKETPKEINPDRLFLKWCRKLN